MIEGLAKKIGYNKIRSIVASGDPMLLNSFIQKTGLKTKIYVAPNEFTKNGVDAVPVVIIETVDDKTIRFDGMTENFAGQNAVSDASLAPQGQQGAKCETK